MNWPTGPVIRLDSTNVDGMNNGLIPHGGDVYTWANSGSFNTPFVPGSISETPLIKKSDRAQHVVAFDGRSDSLVCAGTAVALKFLHTTGLFDIAITMRRTGGVNNGEHRVFGSEPTGLVMGLGPYVDGGSPAGGYKFSIIDGVAQISAFETKTFRAPLGEIACLFIRGTGSAIRVTRDFWDWESQTFLTPITGTGNADHDYAIGAAAGAAGSDYWQGLDLISFLIWNRNLSLAEQLVVKANFDEQETYL